MMWSVTSTSHHGYHSLIIFIITVSLSVSDQYLEEDRHGHVVVTRVSYQDHVVSPRRVIVQDHRHSPRRVIVRKKVIRPRTRVVSHVDRPLAVVPSHSLHPVAGHEEC